MYDTHRLCILEVAVVIGKSSSLCTIWVSNGSLRPIHLNNTGTSILLLFVYTNVVYVDRVWINQYL